MDYFEYSQEIRKEIQKSSKLIKTIENHFSRKQAEFIGKGTSNKVYRIGKLENGLWIALRERIDWQNKHYEQYAQRAEKLSRKGERVSKFCIGVTRSGKAGLLVEDLTQGGKRKLIVPPANEWGYFTDKVYEKVYVDLDNDHYFEELNLKYMCVSACINLKKKKVVKRESIKIIL